MAQYPGLTYASICLCYGKLSGRSEEVLSETVKAPLEQAINVIEDMIYMNSIASNDGSSSTAIFFNVGTAPQESMVNVNNRVQMVLPLDVRRQDVTVLKRS